MDLSFEEYSHLPEAVQSVLDMEMLCGILVALAKPHCPPGADIRVLDISERDADGKPLIRFGVRSRQRTKVDD